MDQATVNNQEERDTQHQDMVHNQREQPTQEAEAQHMAQDILVLQEDTLLEVIHQVLMELQVVVEE